MPHDEAPLPLSAADLTALIGVLARITGLIMAGGIDAEDSAGFLRRAIKDGLVEEGGGNEDLTRALEALIDRARVALGEYR